MVEATAALQGLMSVSEYGVQCCSTKVKITDQVCFSLIRMTPFSRESGQVGSGSHPGTVMRSSCRMYVGRILGSCPGVSSYRLRTGGDVHVLGVQRANPKKMQAGCGMIGRAK